MRGIYAAVLVLLIASCTAAPQTTTQPPPQQTNPLFVTVDGAMVEAQATDWDDDGTPDGNVIYPALLENDKIVEWTGEPLRVEISIWETGIDDEFNTVKETLVYRGEGTIDEWQDGNRLLDEADGIRVPFSEMNPDVQDTYGLLEVTIHTPAGEHVATTELVQIQP